MNALAKYDEMRSALLQIHRVDELQNERNKAEALRKYMKASGESLENQNMMAEIRLRFDRRSGELLGEMERSKPPDTLLRGNTMLPREEMPVTLDDLGVTKMQSSRLQTIAAIPEGVFEEHIAEVKSNGQELTSNGILRIAQEFKRKQSHQTKQEPSALPAKKYRVIYADPPWQYNNAGVITENDNYGRAARHYPTMSIADLCALGEKIKAVVDQNAVLFMWVTSPLLEESFEVIRSWGFQYKTSFVWDKVKHNFGHYNSVRHELLLVCTKGSCTPDEKVLHDSVVSIERSNKHSEKPEEFRRIIDGIYTWGDRIELFARAAVGGWDCWGNEPGQYPVG